MPTPATMAETVPEPDPTNAPTADADEAPMVAGGAGRPTGRDLHALLATSIAGFERMQATVEGTGDGGQAPDGTVDATEHDGAAEPVPVDVLLYRGRSALGRALELRDEIRRRGGQPPPEQLDELYDLLDLAATA